MNVTCPCAHTKKACEGLSMPKPKIKPDPSHRVTGGRNPDSQKMREQGGPAGRSARSAPGMWLKGTKPTLPYIVSSTDKESAPIKPSSEKQQQKNCPLAEGLRGRTGFCVLLSAPAATTLFPIVAYCKGTGRLGCGGHTKISQLVCL